MLQRVPVFENQQTSGPCVISTQASLLHFFATFSYNHSGDKVSGFKTWLCFLNKFPTSLCTNSFCKMGIMIAPTHRVILRLHKNRFESSALVSGI